MSQRHPYIYFENLIVNLITSIDRYMHILSNVSILRPIYVLQQKKVKGNVRKI